jgi:excisionase family DNA binding protein
MKRYDLSVADVAETLKTTPKTVRAWIDDGELAAFRFRGLWRISSEDLAEFVARNVATTVA